ncbi:hypothetical protein ACVWXL_006087 [Bradyrhizobium sp. GM22.5]
MRGLLALRPKSRARCGLFPEAFLSSSVLICEGASEVGLVRGIDQFRTAGGKVPMQAVGVTRVDANGCDNLYRRANAFHSLGYRTNVLRDDDKQPDRGIEETFSKAVGAIFRWREGCALEDELFASLPADAVTALLAHAVKLHGEELVGAHITSAFCVETLEDALALHGRPDVFNTDQGSQFTGADFTAVLAGNGIAISMDGKGAWRDNVFVERLWRSVKYEEVYLRA